MLPPRHCAVQTLDIGTLISDVRALKAPEEKLAGHDESFKGVSAVFSYDAPDHQQAARGSVSPEPHAGALALCGGVCSLNPGPFHPLLISSSRVTGG